MTDVRTGFLPPAGFGYERAFDLAQRVGLDHVELFAETDPWREGFLADPSRVRQAARERGLNLTAHLPFPLDFGSPHESVRTAVVETLESYLDPLGRMGVEKGVLHLNETATRLAGVSAERSVGLALEAAEAAAERGRRHGVEICVENLPGGTFDTDQLERLFAETDVSATLDTGHAVIDGWTASGIAALIREYPDRVTHVHCNDNRVGSDSWRESDEHLPLGAGTVDFETILAPAVDGDWSPTLTMEVVTWADRYVETSADYLHDVLGRAAD